MVEHDVRAPPSQPAAYGSPRTYRPWTEPEAPTTTKKNEGGSVLVLSVNLTVGGTYPPEGLRQGRMVGVVLRRAIFREVVRCGTMWSEGNSWQAEDDQVSGVGGPMRGALHNSRRRTGSGLGRRMLGMSGVGAGVDGEKVTFGGNTSTTNGEIVSVVIARGDWIASRQNEVSHPPHHMEGMDLFQLSAHLQHQAGPSKEWKRGVDFWIRGEVGSLPDELIGPRVMVQLRDRAGQLVHHLSNADVNRTDGLQVIFQTLEKSPIIRQLDRRKIDQRRKRSMQLKRLPRKYPVAGLGQRRADGRVLLRRAAGWCTPDSS